MDSLSPTNIFTLTPIINFKTQKVFCPECHAKLKVHHTDIRKIYTLHIGEIKARRTFMYCANCNHIYSPEEFEKIIPPHSNIGYDVMVLIGRLIFCKHHTLMETVLELEKIYSIIRNKLKKYGITSQLRYRLRYYFGNNTQNINVDEINQTIETTKQINTHDNLIINQVCHILLLWVLDGENHGNGFGFPFDRPHAEFYKRLCLLSERLESLHKQSIVNKTISKVITKIIKDLTPLINDTQCREAFQILSEKEKVFDKLRYALSITLPDKTEGLNDNGEDIGMETIQGRVKDFKKDLLKII